MNLYLIPFSDARDYFFIRLYPISSHILEGSSLTPMPLNSDYCTTKQSAFLDLLCQ